MNNRKCYIVITSLLFIVPLVMVSLKLSQKMTSLQDLLPKEVYHFSYEFDLSKLPQKSFVKTFVPLSTPRQSIRNGRSESTRVFQLSEEEAEYGKTMKWAFEDQENVILKYQFEVEGKSIQYTIPEAVRLMSAVSPALEPYLQSTENIQATHPQIDSLAQQLKWPYLERTLKANFDLVNQIPSSETGVLTDAVTALKRNRASCNGKSRLFVALCRAQGIPARVVGGIILENARKRTSHLWAEVYYEGHWIPFDVLNQHYAYLPANYLSLYKGDRFLVSHTKEAGFDYQFVIQKKYQTTENVASIGPQLWSLLGVSNVSLNLLRGLLLLPLAALIIAIFRNVVGLKTFGIFLPALIGLSMTKSSFLTGCFTLAIVIVLISVLHLALEKWGLLHIPKVVTMLTCVVLVLLALGVLGIQQGWTTLGTAMLFPVVILSITGERFAKILVDDNFEEAMKALGATFFIALVCLSIFQSDLLLGVFLSYPELYLLLLGTMLLLGRWIGMRVLEYQRFAVLSA